MMTPTKETVSRDEAIVAAQTAAIVVDRSNLGLLKFTGETRLDLIHRMSTQDVNPLRSGQGAATVLTSDIGRIIDRLLLYVVDDAVYAVTGENNADNIARYLMRFVFFNDDFHITDLSDETAVLGVYGAQAGSRLSALFGTPVEDLPRHHWQEVSWNNRTLTVHRTDPVADDGYLVMCPAADKDAVWQEMVAQGLVPAGEEAFDYLRIASGLPRFGRELTADYIPLEANLWDDVSFSKGCYIGQEIIARMESRGRLAKKLVRLRPEGWVEPGSEITAGTRKAGTITSIAEGPDGLRALGYVKTAVLESEESIETLRAVDNSIAISLD